MEHRLSHPQVLGPRTTRILELQVERADALGYRARSPAVRSRPDLLNWNQRRHVELRAQRNDVDIARQDVRHDRVGVTEELHDHPIDLRPPGKELVERDAFHEAAALPLGQTVGAETDPLCAPERAVLKGLLVAACVEVAQEVAGGRGNAVVAADSALDRDGFPGYLDRLVVDGLYTRHVVQRPGNLGRELGIHVELVTEDEIV